MMTDPAVRRADIIIRVGAERENPSLPCLSCGYDLRGSKPPAGRFVNCPECGVMADLKVIAAEPARRRALLRWILALGFGPPALLSGLAWARPEAVVWFFFDGPFEHATFLMLMAMALGHVIILTAATISLTRRSVVLTLAAGLAMMLGVLVADLFALGSIIVMIFDSWAGC